ncbi:MAG TPA: hypothetical protein VK543_19005, partial [Puia sp.]|nr:hypothetical protein [Puia sp.]
LKQYGDGCACCGMVEDATFKYWQIIFPARGGALLGTAFASFNVHDKVIGGKWESGWAPVDANAHRFSVGFTKNTYPE